MKCLRRVSLFFNFVAVALSFASSSVSAQSATPTPTVTPGLPPNPTPTANVPSPTPTPVPARLFGLRLSGTVLREGGALDATLLATRAYDSNISFGVEPQFSAPNSQAILIEGPVVLRAGQRSVSFRISAPNDDYANARGEVRLQLRASGAVAGVSSVAQFTYVDNELPALRLQLESATLRAGNVEGGRISGFVSTNLTISPGEVMVGISNSGAQSVFVPSWVMLPTGVGSFTVIGHDNSLLTTPHRVRITVSARGFAPASADITVLPLSAPILRLRMQPPVVDEGETAQMTFVRDGDSSRPATVRLSRNGVALRTVTLGAGVNRVTIPLLFALDNSPFNGRHELFTAQAEGAVTTRLDVRVRNREPFVMVNTNITSFEESAERNATVTLRLTQPWARPLSVRLRRLGTRVRFVQTAAEIVAVSFAAGQTQASVPFVIRDNAFYDRAAEGLSPVEGFALRQPFGNFNRDTLTAVNVVDDEAPLVLRLSANQTAPDPLGINFPGYPDVQAELIAAELSAQAREYRVAINDGSSRSDFKVIIPAGSRSVSFEIPGEFWGEVVRIVATPDSSSAGVGSASATLTRVRIDVVFLELPTIAEDGPRTSIVLRRPDASRAQNLRLSASAGRVRVPAQVSFRAGQNQVTIPVVPINDNIRNINAGELIRGVDANGVERLVVDMLVIDDDTDVPSALETPSDARLLEGRVLSYKRFAEPTLTLLLRFSAPVQALAQANAFAFNVQINSFPLRGSQDLSVNQIGPDVFELRVTNPNLTPGSRLTITPTSVTDEEGLLLPTDSISLRVPSRPTM